MSCLGGNTPHLLERASQSQIGHELLKSDMMMVVMMTTKRAIFMAATSHSICTSLSEMTRVGLD